MKVKTDVGRDALVQVRVLKGFKRTRCRSSDESRRYQLLLAIIRRQALKGGSA